MGNRVSIQRTTFKDEPNGEQSYGYRIFDNYESHYNNFATEEFLSLPIGEVIQIVREDGNTADLLSFIQENESGIYIDGEWYDYEDIKPFL